MDAQGQSAYEKQLGFNPITRWLHSHRHRHTLAELAALPQPLRVLEIGCAEANLFGALNSRFPVEYTGVEIRSDFVRTARARHGSRANFKVLHRSATDLSGLGADVVIALETLEHIPEHDVVRIVESIAALKPKRFICSVPVEVGPAIWLKNTGSFLCRYNRHREYTWRETLNAGLYQLDKLPAHTIHHKGFDWRWLAQTIRHNMRIMKLKHLPVSVFPTGLSTSVFIVAEPHE